MKTQITSFKELYIPKPCHQDWDEMTAAEQGKFCANCRKVVYDFSGKTEEDFNLVYKINGGNICGRFEYDQIDQDYAYTATIKRNPITDRLRKIVAFLITFITLKITSVREVFSQSGVMNGTKIVMVSNDSNSIGTGESAEIHGQVRKEKTEEGMEGAYVNLYDAKGNLITTTRTDVNGFFYLMLSSDVNLHQKFTIHAEKSKAESKARITKYSSSKKKITQKNFESVILRMDIHSRWRRNFLGVKRRLVTGCPKFR